MYEIISFDGVTVPPYLQRGDSQNMGTGSAQTDFRQIPGGGFYRMRRTKRSPQGIRPVTKSCVIWGDSAADARAQLDAWRQKIGVYGKLTVRFFDGSQRWQWAELQDVDAPVAASVKSNYVPLSLTWQTAAQHWNGLIWGSGWTVGDGSFLLGDGSAEVGQTALTFALPSDTSNRVTVTNGGNIDVATLIIEYTNTRGIPQTPISILNLVTGQHVRWTGWVQSNQILRVNTRDMTITHLGTPLAISAISRSTDVNVFTTVEHGLTTGDSVEITGTGRYDGVWHNIVVDNVDEFHFSTPGAFEGYGTLMQGTVREYTDAYADTTFSDPQRWLVLKPGDNEFAITTDTVQIGDYITFYYYDSYA